MKANILNSRLGYKKKKKKLAYLTIPTWEWIKKIDFNVYKFNKITINQFLLRIRFYIIIINNLILFFLFNIIINSNKSPNKLLII